jgi:tetratricopeptide (TPR) repeat protein
MSHVPSQGQESDGRERPGSRAQVQVETPRNRLEQFAFHALSVTLLLLPFFFIPSQGVPFDFTKVLVFFVGTFIALALFLVARLRDGRIAIPKSSVLGAIWLIAASYLLSTLFSENILQSVLGVGFEIDTLGFMVLAATAATLLATLIQKRTDVLSLYAVLFISFVVMALFQTLRLIFGPEFLSLGVLNAATSNVVGKWNDLAIFFGLFAVLSLATLTALHLSRVFKYVIYALLGVSLVFLSIINFSTLWVVLAVFSLGFFVFNLLRQRMPNEGAESGARRRHMLRVAHRASVSSVIVLVVSVLFIVQGTAIDQFVSQTFNISQIEARPSWQSTVNIARDVYESNLFFGTGPATFANQWSQFKPVDVNNTVFWQSQFDFGIGAIPTFFITTGLIGGVAWLLFLGMLVWSGFRHLVLRQVSDHLANYTTLSSFLAALFLWLMMVLYTPSIVIASFAFIFTGIFIATLRFHEPSVGTLYVSMQDNPRAGFVTVLGLTILLILSAVATYTVGQYYAAAVTHQRALVAGNVNGNISKAEERAERALALFDTTRSHRTIAQAKIAQLNQIQQNQDLTQQELQEQFRDTLATAIDHAQTATERDGQNYRNWETLARVYHSVAPVNVEGAYERAVEAYDDAIERSPNNPTLYLARARLALTQNNADEARQYIRTALEKKGNYTEAIFLLSQLQVQEGNIDEAIRSVQQATLIEPNNPVIYFQLGFLHYNQGNYQESIAALEEATRLSDQYANARYFLGLAYHQVGARQRAIQQFERVQETNSDNREVQLILQNLRAGRAPFANTQQNPPEERSGLPVEQGGQPTRDGDGQIIGTEDSAAQQ